MAHNSLADASIALEEACALLWQNRRELLHARAARMREKGKTDEEILGAINCLSNRLWAAAQHVLQDRMRQTGANVQEAALSLYNDDFFDERDLIQILEIDRWQLDALLDEARAD